MFLTDKFTINKKLIVNLHNQVQPGVIVHNTLFHSGSTKFPDWIWPIGQTCNNCAVYRPKLPMHTCSKFFIVIFQKIVQNLVI